MLFNLTVIQSAALALSYLKPDQVACFQPDLRHQLGPTLGSGAGKWAPGQTSGRGGGGGGAQMAAFGEGHRCAGASAPRGSGRERLQAGTHPDDSGSSGRARIECQRAERQPESGAQDDRMEFGRPTGQRIGATNQCRQSNLRPGEELDEKCEEELDLERLILSVWANLKPLLEAGEPNSAAPFESIVRKPWLRLLATDQPAPSKVRCGESQLGQVIPLEAGGARNDDDDDSVGANACGPGADDWPASGHEEQRGAPAADSRRTMRFRRARFIEDKVKLACLSFLRSAAFLQEHLYGFQTPPLECMRNEQRALLDRSAIEADFESLVCCLSLASQLQPAEEAPHERAQSRGQAPGLIGGGGGGQPTLSGRSGSLLVRALNWPTNSGQRGELLVASWCRELLAFGRRFPSPARELLLDRPLHWHRPSFMQLPSSFDDIFMHFLGLHCQSCGSLAKDAAVCLACGATVCFRQGCCKESARERRLHAQQCGAGTAVLLALRTSSVVVVRGQWAFVWGSLYLDEHEEEDSGLQRGKPLFLVPQRRRLLERQWLAHSFNHTSAKRWIHL